MLAFRAIDAIGYRFAQMMFRDLSKLEASQSRKITHTLTDEKERMVMSEKLLEVQTRGNDIVAVGDQFGRGMNGH